MNDLRDLFDIAEDGQLSLAVPGEQMPLDGLAAAPAGTLESPPAGDLAAGGIPHAGRTDPGKP